MDERTKQPAITNEQLLGVGWSRTCLWSGMIKTGRAATLTQVALPKQEHLHISKEELSTWGCEELLGQKFETGPNSMTKEEEELRMLLSRDLRSEDSRQISKTLRCGIGSRCVEHHWRLQCFLNNKQTHLFLGHLVPSFLFEPCPSINFLSVDFSSWHRVMRWSTWGYFAADVGKRSQCHAAVFLSSRS